MAVSIVAQRYAKALAAAAGSNLDKVLSDLTTLVGLMDKDDALRALVTNTAIGPATRQRATDALVKAANLAGTVLGNALLLLSERNKLHLLPALREGLSAIVDQKAGRTRGVLTSAVAAGADAVKSIETALSKATGKTVQLTHKVDATLLGGAVARVGSHTYDGSVKSQLMRLGRQLTN